MNKLDRTLLKIGLGLFGKILKETIQEESVKYLHRQKRHFAPADSNVIDADYEVINSVELGPGKPASSVKPGTKSKNTTKRKKL